MKLNYRQQELNKKGTTCFKSNVPPESRWGREEPPGSPERGR